MDIHAQQNAYASRMRIYAQERRFSEASMVEPPSPRHSLPSMRGEVRASRGLVVNIASLAGTIPAPGLAAYGAAKAGVISLTRSLNAVDRLFFPHSPSGVKPV